MPVTNPAQTRGRGQSPPRVNPFTTAFYGQAQLDLLFRLDTKRRQIDREIQEFKTAKETEYLNYEQMLREYYDSTGELPEETGSERRFRERERERAQRERDQGRAYYEPDRERAQRRAGVRALATPPNSQQIEQADNLHNRKSGPTNPPIHPVSALQSADSSRNSKSSPVISRGPPQPHYATSGRLSHEHERELRGVFTPNYLPLLDGTTNNKDRRSSSDLLEASTLGTSESPNVNRGHVTGLSSSAEYHHLPMTSPPAPPARPLSASVPQEDSLGHRRSSSTGTSDIANRRSSLRNKQEPRSPKRVLFNIDNTVVSPSTSPIAQRENSKTPTKASRAEGGSGNNDSFAILKNKPAKTAPNSESAMPSLLSSSFTGTAANGWKSEMSPLRWAYESENKNKNSPLGGGDDFEHVDKDDDMFAFDEELEAGEKAEASDKKAGVDFDREGEKQETETQDTLVGSSPHAGSLPIEIKWPGKSGSFRGGSP